MSDIIMLSDFATPKTALAPLVAEFMKRVWVVGDSSAILEMFSAKARIRGLEEQDQVVILTPIHFPNVICNELGHTLQHVVIQ